LAELKRINFTVNAGCKPNKYIAQGITLG